MHLTEPAPDVRGYRADTPAPMAQAIARALEKDPARRWQTAQEMGEALG
jgi:post-segregation antitoxin (ccd killing protein)